MVLATKLNKASCLLLALLCAGCQADEANIIDKTTIAGYELQIVIDKTNCKLLSTKDGEQKTTPLNVKPPCHFIRRDNGETQQHAYPDKSIQALVLIVGTSISEEKRQKWNLEKGLVCGEQRQAIFITANEINVSDSILEGGIACKDKGADEKDFAFFAQQFE
ncbi:hypothetical protein O59_003691 [Cellvibrio sp. BR]|uniref:hypothetical protein n=1 Tax=Cellvibrio sp. BR TaxID=1134474 RepID=UPI000260151A|nr:hypothetical protein [Cellvibrio sp. BR]EIK43811.1 hypothetical protein O59_003691 [Cellvibrio sp. BR]